MPRNVKITRITVHQYNWESRDLGTDYNGFNTVYSPGAKRTARGHVLAIETDAGITGEFAGGDAASYVQVGIVARYLLGKNPLERERLYNDIKRAMRKLDRMGMGPIDIALWDIAGKAYDAPICELLGGWKQTLPAYASTLHGDHVAEGGLSSPVAFADFALQCKQLGYKAYKIHGWGNDPADPKYIEREVDNVLEVRKRVGPGMDLMLDPACEYDTWADTLKVGKACDEANFFWYEDPFKDGGISAFAHKKLRELIKTPLLLGEHVRHLETRMDFTLAGGTDFVRVDSYYDGGITGALKVAHAAEALGLDVEIHAPGPAHRHLMAAIRNTNYYELGLVHPSIKTNRPPIYADGYSDDLDAVDSRGHVPVPQGPGLGVTLDWDYLRRHESGKVVYE
ncbi:MAG: mandelate racemase [Chloroflexi bacterium]|nr:mandelate racemase [Chloroflexota bacterium]